MKIVLLGYRGSGKSTVGAQLAERCGTPFVDLDHEICAAFGNRSVASIWAHEGEPAFRETEGRLTRQHMASERDMVIALGGGTVMQTEAHRAVAEARATRIYLACEVAELQRRLENAPGSRGHRPSLTGGGDAASEIEQVLAERDPVYRGLADVIVDVTQKEPARVADEVMRRTGGGPESTG
jgi:shikimate kinase